MDKTKFEEELKRVNEQRATRYARIGQLGKVAKQKIIDMLKMEAEIYDQIGAIVANEGGDVIKAASGGRYANISPDPATPCGYKIEYRFNDSWSMTDTTKMCIVRKDDTSIDVDKFDDVTTMEELKEATDTIDKLAERISIANNGIEVYFSWRSLQLKEFDDISDKIEPEEHDGYW